MRAFRCRTPWALALVAGSAAVFAQTPQEHSAHHPDEQAATAAAPANAGKPPGGTGEESVKEMHERATKMHNLMEQIKGTRDPAERARLLKQHREVMLEQVQAMQHMGCRMGMSGAPQGETGSHGQMDHGGPTMAPQGAPGGGMMSEMMQCHQLTQERMDMTALMLQEMLEHEKAER